MSTKIHQRVTDALHVERHGPGDYKVIVTLVNTRLNGTFPSSAQAIAAAKAADEICDWNSMVLSAATGDFETRRDQYREEWYAIRARHGGTDCKPVNIQNNET